MRVKVANEQYDLKLYKSHSMIQCLPSNLISIGTLLGIFVLNTKTDFLSGSAFETLFSVSRPTWHGHVSYCALKWSTHVFSQAWSFLQSMIHCPKSILLSLLHVSRFALFCDKQQIGFGQLTHPFGQLVLQGQS